jgi:hypothetical protein
VHQLCIDFRRAYDLFRREVLYNILIEFHVTLKLVRLIEICLNETFNTIHIGKNFVCILYSEWSGTRVCFITITFQLSFRICH